MIMLEHRDNIVRVHTEGDGLTVLAELLAIMAQVRANFKGKAGKFAFDTAILEFMKDPDGCTRLWEEGEKNG